MIVKAAVHVKCCNNFSTMPFSSVLHIVHHKLNLYKTKQHKNTSTTGARFVQHLLVTASIARNEEHRHAAEAADVLGEVDLLPALMVQEQSVPVRGHVPGRGGDGDVGRVHVGHDAPVGHRPQQPAKRRERDPGGEEQHGAHPASAPHPVAAAHGDRRPDRSTRYFLQDGRKIKPCSKIQVKAVERWELWIERDPK